MENKITQETINSFWTLIKGLEEIAQYLLNSGNLGIHKDFYCYSETYTWDRLNDTLDYVTIAFEENRYYEDRVYFKVPLELIYVGDLKAILDYLVDEQRKKDEEAERIRKEREEEQRKKIEQDLYFKLLQYASKHGYKLVRGTNETNTRTD